MPTIKLTPITRPIVTLQPLAADPREELWLAFRTCYSAKTPHQLAEQYALSRDEDIDWFMEKRLNTGHTSPLEHINFTFLIADVSRAFTHQFVRHRVGISISQQSGRYTNPLSTGEFRYVKPDRIDLHDAVKACVTEYHRLLNDGCPEEDARMILPNCQATNMVVTINYAALLHMADIRLCTLAQKEFQQVVLGMRREVHKAYPVLGKYLQPKCGHRRKGVCDEELDKYKACVLSSVRPHKDLVNVDMV